MNRPTVENQLSGTGGARQEPDEEFRVETLSKRYGSNSVLDRIDLSILRGGLMAIIGQSGCGKSVLLRLMLGLEAPDAGRVLARDRGAELMLAGGVIDPSQRSLRALDYVKIGDRIFLDVNQISEERLRALRKRWGVVFQSNALYGGSVYDNVALWMREHTTIPEPQMDAIVEDSLHAVGLDPAEVSPKLRNELSGGMAKRVAVARAIATDPEIIFYDEPTAGLDPELSAQIHELIWRLHKEPRRVGGARTTVVITHDRDLLQRLRPRVIMLADRAIFFRGSYEEFESYVRGPARLYFASAPVLNRAGEDAR